MVAGPVKGRLVPTSGGSLAFTALWSVPWPSRASLRLDPSRLPAKRREGIGSSAPHVRVTVFERGFEWLGGARVANVAQGTGGSPTHAPARVIERGRENVEWAGIADLAEGLGGGLSDVHSRALESSHERSQRAGITDLAERLGGSQSYARIVVFEGGNEGLDGVDIADLAERYCGVPPHTPELLILQCFDQPRSISSGLEPIDVGRSEQRQM